MSTSNSNATASTSSSTFSPTRLYVGNLSATVDEYSLMQVCAKYGKISKLDYLFHKSGPSKGKPRGYAFVEYATKEEALKAQTGLHDKLVRGRKLMVTPASEQSQHPEDVRMAALSGKGRTGPQRGHEAARPTTISLLKGQGVSGATTNKKIAALEAKLAALRQAKAPSSAEGEKWLDGLDVPLTTGEEEIEGKVPIVDKVAKVNAGLPMRPVGGSTEVREGGQRK